MKHYFTLLLFLSIVGQAEAQKNKNHTIPFDGLKGKVKRFEQISYKMTGSGSNLQKANVDRYYICEFNEEGLIIRSQLSKNLSGDIIQKTENKIVNGEIIATTEQFFMPEKLIYKTQRVNKKDNIEKWSSSYMADGRYHYNSYSCEYQPDRKIWTDVKTGESDIQIYDEDDHLISRTMYSDNRIKQQYLYKYNNDGLIIKFEVAHYNFKRGIQVQTFVYEGEDSYGNWSRRITYDNGVVDSLMEQTVEYWE